MMSRPEPETPDTAAPRRIVLLVEDNPTDIFVVKWVLQHCSLDLEVHAAADGQEAVSYLHALCADGGDSLPTPALVLLDLNLPKINGAEVLRELRQNARCKDVPVIVVTSSLAGSDRQAAEELGAQAYFQKPTELEKYMELGDLVRSLLP